MPKVKSIDIQKGSFESNGTKYYFDSDGMCYDRMVKFVSMLPEVGYGLTYLDVSDHLKKQIDILRKGNSMAANYVDALEHTLNFSKRIKKSNNETYFLDNIDLYLDFCCLFINTEEEDTTVWKKPIMDKKKEDWKKDMNMEDFFLLAKLQVPGFKQLSKELYRPELTEKKQ